MPVCVIEEGSARHRGNAARLVCGRGVRPSMSPLSSSSLLWSIPLNFTSTGGRLWVEPAGGMNASLRVPFHIKGRRRRNRKRPPDLIQFDICRDSSLYIYIC